MGVERVVRRGAGAAAALLMASLAMLLVVAPAAAVTSAAVTSTAGERIATYDVLMVVSGDGSLQVTESIDYDFGVTPKHGITREIPTRVPYDSDNDRLYRLRDVSVSSPDSATPTDVERTDDGGVTRLRIGDPDQEITGHHTYVVRYTIDGAFNRFPDHDELFWNAIGTDWSVPIDAASAAVTATAPVREVACFEGPARSNIPCAAAQALGKTATFSAKDGLGAFEGLTIVVGLPRSAVHAAGPILEERRTFSRVVTPTPLTGVLGAGVIALGGAGVLWLLARSGRDRRWAGLTPGLAPAAGMPAAEEPVPLRRDPAAVAFTPPQGLRPGQIGTLLDEQANVIDVTATIVDLAVRGYLRIEELDRKHWFTTRDWRLLRLDPPMEDEGLLPFEEELYDGLFETGDDVRLSDLKSTFAARLARVQTRLYEDVTAAGWFHGRPDRVRAHWSIVGLVIAVAGGVLTWQLGKHLLHWAVVGAAVVAVGLLLTQASRRMPARTPAGSAVLSQAEGFRTYIRTAEAEQLRFEERADIFSRYLPYAIVFGEAERWVRVFGALAVAGQAGATAGPAWYVGPAGWDPGHFSSSLTGFTTSASSTFAAATPSSSGSSGFGGGGSSGGGGGGGGGGSW